ncbi:MAG: 50S ribosomal protein L35 [Simkania sp.]|nr:50S ribosomal protein L35 [Simkania sp.]
MTKMKTCKSVTKKFKLTGTGKLIRKSPGRSHLLAHKSSKRKRAMSRDKLVDKGQLKTYKLMMGVN